MNKIVAQQPIPRMEHKVMRRVFVFSVPVRVFHWVNALTTFLLIGTGLIIANPPAIQSGQEASFGYWFGTVRFIHFASAYVFAANFVLRIYWFFVGNRYERLNNFIPWGKKFWHEFRQVIRMDVFLKRNEQHMSIGHNPVAALSYFVIFICMLIMTITGFSLYAEMSTMLFANWFQWCSDLLGGDIMTRIVHHWVMWVFILFIMVHLYLVFYHDYVEGRGETSSMVGGWKFIEKERLEKKKEDSEND
jgi:Ni/Fe-hydrogenase 1 B-type cytochrome subunit